MIEGKSIYVFMDNNSIRENIFLDTEEQQVQPKTCAASAAAIIGRPNFDWDIPVFVNNDSEVQSSTRGISAAPSLFLPGLTNTSHQKNINPEIDCVTSVITPHHLEIFRDKSLQFTRNAAIRVNAGNRLFLNMI